jgi:hypothetical protein
MKIRILAFFVVAGLLAGAGCSRSQVDPESVNQRAIDLRGSLEKIQFPLPLDSLLDALGRGEKWSWMFSHSDRDSSGAEVEIAVYSHPRLKIPYTGVYAIEVVSKKDPSGTYAVTKARFCFYSAIGTTFFSEEKTANQSLQPTAPSGRG